MNILKPDKTGIILMPWFFVACYSIFINLPGIIYQIISKGAMAQISQIGPKLRKVGLGCSSSIREILESMIFTSVKAALRFNIFGWISCRIPWQVRNSLIRHCCDDRSNADPPNSYMRIVLSLKRISPKKRLFACGYMDNEEKEVVLKRDLTESTPSFIRPFYRPFCLS